MKIILNVFRIAVAFIWVAFGLAQDGEPTAIKLKKSFLQAQKDKLLVESSFIVTKTTSIHGIFDGTGKRGVKDSDLHVLGLAPTIGLPVVAEVVDAYRRDALGISAAVTFLQEKSKEFDDGQESKLSMKGVLRIWPEHASGVHAQKPGAKLHPMETKDQNHLVEIHPITQFEDFDLTPTCTMIEGFVPHNASQAIPTFKKATTHIKGSKDTVTVVFEGSLKYNYFSIQFKAKGAPKKLEGGDGEFIYAAIYDENGKLHHHKMKLVWGLDWPVAEELKTLEEGKLLVMPRLSLPLVAWRLEQQKVHPELGVLDWHLPYELVVLGVMDKETVQPNDEDIDEE